MKGFERLMSNRTAVFSELHVTNEGKVILFSNAEVQTNAALCLCFTLLCTLPEVDIYSLPQKKMRTPFFFGSP